MSSKLLQNFIRSKLKFFKNDPEIELALGALRELGWVWSGVRLV
jgi:hypothetical protein